LGWSGRAARAVTVAEAMRLCTEECFDVLICDIGLPDGDGWDLLAQMRRHCPVKAIADSVYGLTTAIDRSRAAGFDAHLTKPFAFATLMETIKGLTGAGEVSQAPI
jgi:CheY-like chemotaxis protein